MLCFSVSKCYKLSASSDSEMTCVTVLTKYYQCVEISIFFLFVTEEGEKALHTFFVRGKAERYVLIVQILYLFRMITVNLTRFEMARYS